jgi:hypothetical protein
MSNWQEIKKEDIELDGEDINIYLGSDDFGNNYVILKVKDVKDLLDNIKGK